MHLMGLQVELQFDDTTKLVNQLFVQTFDFVILGHDQCGSNATGDGYCQCTWGYVYIASNSCPSEQLKPFHSCDIALPS